MNTHKPREIGSEFEWSTAFLNTTGSSFPKKGVRFFSGRAALYATVLDAVKNHTITRAWLPSYCCSSMMQPFLQQGIPVRFYQVDRCETGGVKREAFEPRVGDLVLSMAYFGFADKQHEELLQLADACGAVTIEDCTHSLLMTTERVRADYRIASLRKWFPIACGGWAMRTAGDLETTLTPPSKDIIDVRLNAMQRKAVYLQDGGEASEKQAYLDAYRTFNKQFEDLSTVYAIDPWSDELLQRTDVSAIRQQRRRNAQVLLDGLKKLPKVTPWLANIEEGDCPLFLPIVTPQAKALQAYLATQEIYCPMHWPRPCEQALSDLYSQEVSLIVDQRYNEDDMFRILDVLEQFCKEA